MGSRRFARVHLVATAACMLLLQHPAYAQMYKCVTEGVTSFSDKPCGKDAKLVAPVRAWDPSEEDRKEAAARAERDKSTADNFRKERELEDAKQAAKPKKPAVTMNMLAAQCVDRYKPHLAYPGGVRIESHNLVVDGFGKTLHVNVRTITNNSMPAGFDPIFLREKFLCRLTSSGDSIDSNYTNDYVEKHKKGERLKD